MALRHTWTFNSLEKQHRLGLEVKQCHWFPHQESVQEKRSPQNYENKCWKDFYSFQMLPFQKTRFLKTCVHSLYYLIGESSETAVHRVNTNWHRSSTDSQLSKLEDALTCTPHWPGLQRTVALQTWQLS